MDTPPVIKPAGRRWIKGCLIWLMAAAALMAWAFWQIGEPGRRAKLTLASIEPGMNALEIASRVTGRHYIVYQVQREKEWEIITREEFQKLTTTPRGGAAAQLRLMLTFMGMSPGRVSIFLDVGPDGRIVKVNKPYNWD